MRPVHPRFGAARGALLLCVVTVLLSGCSLFHRHKRAGCYERPFTGNADSRPALKVPEGMSAPDTRTAVKIPTLTEPETPRAKTDPCLDQPPSYGTGPTVRPPGAKPAAPAAPAPAAPLPMPPVPTAAPPAPAGTETAPAAPAPPPDASPAAPPAVAPPATAPPATPSTPPTSGAAPAAPPAAPDSGAPK